MRYNPLEIINLMSNLAIPNHLPIKIKRFHSIRNHIVRISHKKYTKRVGGPN